MSDQVIEKKSSKNQKRKKTTYLSPELLVVAEAETNSADKIPENIARKIHAYKKIAEIIREDGIEQEYLEEDFDALELLD